MNEKIPPWLKAMQNGALGEARARAFLMDRFWILERSVDIDGADLIIQRRLTSQNLLDKNPPKLGFVQVKFFESEGTTHYIPKAYITDQEDKLRDEFFLLCHSGFEENARSFFMTSEMISTDFSIVQNSGIEKYSISGSKVLNNNKYLVVSNANTLNRIENKLMFADFRKNREFISWKLPNILIDSSAILPIYNEPIVNSWGHIPSEFKKIKEGAIKAMKEIESLYLDLKEIADEVDPIEAFTKIEILEGELGISSYGSWGRSVMESLYDENFYYTCTTHKEKVEALRDDGLLDKFIAARDKLRTTVSVYLCSKLPIDSNTVHSMVIEFSSSNFEIILFTNNLIPASEYFNVPNKLN